VGRDGPLRRRQCVLVFREFRAGIVVVTVEVPTMNVIDVAVAVVIQAVADFTRIGEKVAGAIGMIQLCAGRLYSRNDNSRVAG